jgi:hypothetical protein
MVGLRALVTLNMNELLAAAKRFSEYERDTPHAKGPS